MVDMYLPLADEQLTAVTSSPLPAEVREPTCLFLLIEIILERYFGTEEIPVSSQFQMFSTCSWFVSTTSSKEKNNQHPLG